MSVPSTTEIEQRIIDIIAKEAQIDRALLNAKSTMDDFGVPSIAQFEALFAIEEAFDVELPDEPDDLTLGGLAERIRTLLEARGA